MANKKVYYTDEYRDCHDTLSKDGKKKLAKAQKLYDKVTNDFDDFENIASDTDDWEGQMASLFKHEYFGYVKDCYSRMIENIVNSLEPGYAKLDELVSLFEQLKTTSEKYSNLLIEYSIEKSKNIQPLIRIYGKNNQATNSYEPNPEYAGWIKRLNDLAMEIDILATELDELKMVIFDTLSQIDGFDDNVVELFNFIDCINLTIGEDITFYEEPVFSEKNSENDNLYMYSYNGVNYSIICDGYFLNLYESFLQDKRYYQQRGSWYPSRCNEASSVYSHNLNNGIINTNWLKSSKNISGLYEKITQVSYDAKVAGALMSIKNDVYYEIINGRSCALQVGNEASGGRRHWVTIVGFSENVKGPSDLTPENILILDNWDGKVQTLAENGRDFYAWGSKKNESFYQLRKSSSDEVASLIAKRSNDIVVASN